MSFLFCRQNAATFLAPLLLILVCGETIGLFGIQGFTFVNPQGSVQFCTDVMLRPNYGRCTATRHQHGMELNLGLGEYSVDLESPLGMILEERGDGENNVVLFLLCKNNARRMIFGKKILKRRGASATCITKSDAAPRREQEFAKSAPTLLDVVFLV